MSWRDHQTVVGKSIELIITEVGVKACFAYKSDRAQALKNINIYINSGELS